MGGVTERKKSSDQRWKKTGIETLEDKNLNQTLWNTQKQQKQHVEQNKKDQSDQQKQ